MINPSAPGWIEKFFNKLQLSETTETVSDDCYYQRLRNTGFIYGHIISFDIPFTINTSGWFQEEVSKVALLNALYTVFSKKNSENNKAVFVEKATAFYNEMHPESFSIITKILPKNSTTLTLEKIIAQRVLTNNNSINKNFSHLVTNALLFIDVLAFHHYLIHGEIPVKYLKKIEETVINIVTLALKIKTNKSQYDDLLIKLFEASIRYTKFSKTKIITLETIDLDYFTADLEKMYLIDMAGMALWSDGILENNESYFLYTLGQKLSISDDFVTKSIHSTNSFIIKHKADIPYFNYSNPVKHFYDQITQSVVTLISRNKTRLVKEILESKELMILLAQSTLRELNEKEKKKVKKQLLDICKTVPSLAIFLLPGGSLLLPILIKFIPKLLPSAFNENLDND